MGFGIGIGMGWPMASSSSSANLGYFTITEICGRVDPRPIMMTSQLINTNLYNRGDYVDASDNRGNYFRVCLGGIATEPSRDILTISGPTYTSCPSLVRFSIEAFCNEEPHITGCSNLVDSSIYNTGDYVFCDDLGIRVLLGEIVPDDVRCLMNYNISGPVYNSCPEPPFTGYFGFQEYCNGGETERTYYGPTTQTWQVGQVVRNIGAPIADNYVIINSIVPDLGGEYYPMTELQGPALNSCPIP
jgi:hypothetical protein